MAQIKNGQSTIVLQLKGTDKEILKQARLITKKLNSKFNCDGELIACYSKPFGSMDEPKDLLEQNQS